MIAPAQDEDDISVEERYRILDEVAREKGYRDAEHLRNRAAKNRGWANWNEYRNYLFRAGQIHLTKRQERRIFPETRKKKRKPKRALGRLIGKSLRGIRTKKQWIRDRLNDPLPLLRQIQWLRPTDIYEFFEVNGHRIPHELQAYI